MGRYTGLLHLGHESLGARGVPVYAMPRMQACLIANEPWRQLVRYENVALCDLADGEIPGRDMSTFPHPFLTHRLDRLGALPEAGRAKVRFLHLDHTNPALSRAPRSATWSRPPASASPPNWSA